MKKILKLKNNNNFFKKIIIIFLSSFIILLTYNFFLIKDKKNFSNWIVYFYNLAGIAQLITELIIIKFKSLRISITLQITIYLSFLLVLNIPILFFGYKKINKINFFLNICWFCCIVFFSICFVVYDEVFKKIRLFLSKNIFVFKTFNEILQILFCALINGVFYGILLNKGCTFGGFDTIISYICIKRKNISKYSKIIAFFNCFTVILYIWIVYFIKNKNNQFNIKKFLNFELIFCSILYIAITNFIIKKKFIRYQLVNLYIISNNCVKIRDELYKNNFQYGGNIINSKGLYKINEKREIIITVISMFEYNKIKHIIYNIDKKALIYILKVNQISKNFILK